MNRVFTITAIAFLGIAPAAFVLGDVSLSTATADEAKPRIQFARDWSRFLPSDRARCLKLTLSSTGTYTDLLTCLENKRDESRFSEYERQPAK